MSDKLEKRIREVEEEHAAEMLDEHLSIYHTEERDKALLILGGIRAADRIAKVISSESLQTLIRFQEERLHERLGLKQFVDLLQHPTLSPMSKHEFYNRKTLFEKEGVVLFDLLNGLGVSIRQRKLLGKGNVELDGDTVIIRDGDDTSEILLTERTRLLETLSALADSNADRSVKLERQKQKIANHDAEKQELYDEIDRLKTAGAVAAAADPHMIALVELQIAYRKLAEMAGGLSDADKHQLKGTAFSRIAACNQTLAEAYAHDGEWTTLTPSGPASTGDADLDYIDALIDRVQSGDDDDNEAALTAQL